MKLEFKVSFDVSPVSRFIRDVNEAETSQEIARKLKKLLGERSEFADFDDGLVAPISIEGLEIRLDFITQLPREPELKR